MLFSIIGFANVLPPSLLALNSGISTPVLLVHHVTYTLLPDAAISVFWSTTFPLFGALNIIIFNVLPPSVLFAKNTFQCPVSLFAHAINTLFPDVAMGAARIVASILGDVPGRVSCAAADCIAFSATTIARS